jgi:hypothetical protein
VETAAIPPIRPVEPSRTEPAALSQAKLAEPPHLSLTTKLAQLPAKTATQIAKFPEKAFAAVTPSDEWRQRHRIASIVVDAVLVASIAAAAFRCGAGPDS